MKREPKDTLLNAAGWLTDAANATTEAEYEEAMDAALGWLSGVDYFYEGLTA